MPTNGGVRNTGGLRVGNTMTQWSLSREIKIYRVNISSVLDQGYVRGFHAAKAMSSFKSDLGHFVEGSKYYYQRVAEPEEIANIGVFLASHLSASINGQNTVADSGKAVAALGETVIGPVCPMLPF
ncbi:hypothetical protein INS49_014571 [Diaporthe citri]|uniref:uncharacterized protein n=1 Tax=Diaporthe citri TaxID=83186 RepID=UPI001C7F9D52|nr:uncharacterized protein INS49_014571 [Diaporthe citri]KAG6356697.1 hypothetical protein INS49_014571 [Diaporthe citri]